MMKYMIHASPQRMWYVDNFLLPSLEARGIPREEICVWCDTDGKGNLFSFMESARVCGRLGDGAVWHLQDDVAVCSDFAARTQAISSGVANGFACSNWDLCADMAGTVPVKFAWYSFQCVRIPNAIAGELADWFYREARYRNVYADRIRSNKGDDWFFRAFLRERYPKSTVTNVKPNLVEHVDFLIGGTLINKNRLLQFNRAAHWAEPALVEELEKQIKAYQAGR